MAALLVFASHLRNLLFDNFDLIPNPTAVQKLLYFITGLGHESVMIFFVASGYLVGGPMLNSARQGAWQWRRYAIDRGTRLVPTLYAALIVGVVVDLVGMRLFGANNAYGGLDLFRPMVQSPVSEAINIRTVLGNACFLQTILVPPLGSNGALWSLANEFWYYLLFPCVVLIFYGRSRWTSRAVACTLIFGAVLLLPPLIWAYMIVWCVGVLLPFVPSPPARGRPLLTALSACMVVGALVASRFRVAPMFVTDSFLAVTFGSLLWCLRDRKRPLFSPRLAKLISLNAGWSYSLYLFHLPILFFAQAGLQGDRKWAFTPIGLLAGAGIGLIAWAGSVIAWWAIERRTPAFRAFARTLLSNSEQPGGVIANSNNQ